MTLPDKKVFIKTYGCQMNVYDSNKMIDILAPLGYTPTERPEVADMVVINTCHIREKASEKTFSELGRLSLFKKRKQAIGQDMVIAVTGCVAQAEGEEIQRRAPFVDIVVGPQTYHRLGAMVKDVLSTKKKNLDIEFPVESKFDFLPEKSLIQGVSAFLSVQEGCDKFCSFCVVPYTRGVEYSRSVSDILAEAQRLVDHGAREIVLLGQNVNAYHGEALSSNKINENLNNIGTQTECNLAGLLKYLDKIENIKRLRYTTSHPLDMTQDLINVHQSIEKLMPFLHLPVQSGSNAVLQRMNRQYSVDDYYKIINELRKVRSDLALSSDFIVGFPGETDRDFKQTIELIQNIEFAQAYSFKYSIRPGTPGSLMDDQVEEHVKTERLEELQALLKQQQKNYNQKFVHQKLPVLFEKQGKYKNQYVGKTPYMQSVHVESKENLIGHLKEIWIAESHSNSFKGQLMGDM
ncbi:MAG: tRNA (N6-isopentenyl adenosine(37)-C2)-methylthiotransferase MiaB [Alphaproteobacteria bacterium]|nr:tRNA (N6-isopentenyl adenosine(37)-C2)-methylthiotransferase MiaB [Alphaproteobacteria bacterium]